MTLTRVKLAMKSFLGELSGRLPRLTLSSADWIGTTSAVRSSTAAYLAQTVFAVRLRVNFHFHHHRIRTSNVAQHFFWPCLLGVFGFKSMRQLWSVLEAPPTSSVRHFLGPSLSLLTSCASISMSGRQRLRPLGAVQSTAASHRRCKIPSNEKSRHKYTLPGQMLATRA